MFRFFSSRSYTSGSNDLEEIWAMGETISCSVNEDLMVDVLVPSGFNGLLPFKILTHGFNDQVTGDKINYAKAWLETANEDINVILLDWPDLAAIFQFGGLDDFMYDEAARNAIDLGEYFGYCLSDLWRKGGVSGSNVHMVGHSLGAHLMAKAGRTFKELTEQSIGRITGLDPAGPRFIDGPILNALPELSENRINPDSASFVDIIHTDGSCSPALVSIDPNLGDLNQLGHSDFYPQGGSEQPGCQSGFAGALCNHGRSAKYFLHSVWEPELFPSQECSGVEACSNSSVVSSEVQAFMGDPAQVSYMLS